ncbi:MAG: hypothetical protein ISS57_00725 [Anaerolineales bacterium]|nr:hypothetical protein [Anaerolineales bacterium]
MDASDARAYIERWREVELIERMEAQAASFQDRWRQLNAIFGLAHALGLFLKPVANQEEVVWQRWASLSQIERDDQG